MDTVRVNICYRPLRIAWAIESNDKDSFRRAVRLSHAFWGGRFNPVVFVDKEAEADQLVDAFRADVVWPLGTSERANAFPKRYRHLINPFFPEELFLGGDREGEMRSHVLDVMNLVSHAHGTPAWKAIEDQGLRRYVWDAGDPLADAFLMQFGEYPDPKDVGIDYLDAVKKAIKIADQAISTTEPITAGVLAHPSLAYLSRHGFRRHYSIRPGWSYPGFFSGDAADLEDLVCFWNLRACDIPLQFIDLKHLDRYSAIVPEYRKLLEERLRGGQGPDRRTALWSRKEVDREARKALGEDFLSCVVSDHSWNGLNLRPPMMYLGDASALGVVSRDQGSVGISFALADRPFSGDLWFRTQHLVASVSLIGVVVGAERHALRRIGGRESVSRPAVAECTHMAKAIPKVTLSASRDIPFNKLVLSQSNVRRTKAGISIEDLAEDIARRGLLQSLNVRPVLEADGAETGMFEIPAGGRRFRALELLVKQKRLSKTALIPCVVRDPAVAISAEEDSLAENVHRVALHPLDQFRAFKALRDEGGSDEEIAARFFVSPAVVKQRLRLATVSAKLLDVYAEDGVTLEQLMAFTVTTDQARQEQVWEALQHSYNNEPYLIRRQLTDNTVRASDRRARFVGLESYEAAGGALLRDLFEDDGGGWLQDAGLLDRLATEKLAVEAEKIAGEGWKWIEVALDFRYGHAQHLRRLDGVQVDLTLAQQMSVDALTAEQAKLESEHERADELPDEIDARLGEIETALAAFEDRPAHYEPAEKARAGVFVSIDSDGRLSVDRGYVRPEDEPQIPVGDQERAEGESGESDEMASASANVQRTVITIGGERPDDDVEDDAIKPLPERLVGELTAHRTLALRDAVANSPQVALTMLLHKLCLDTFQHSTPGTCLEASVRHVFFPVQAADLKDSPSAKAVAERHEAWKAELPKDERALWDWLSTLDESRRAALLAHCVSFGVNALYEKGDRYGGAGVSAHGVQQRIAQADRLARAVGLDMVDAGWRPTVDNYLGRVTKPRILEAVREAKGEQAAQLIDHLKKPEMAKEAERLLDATGWLPEPLRLADRGDLSTPINSVQALPAFLADEQAQEAVMDGSGQLPIAAE